MEIAKEILRQLGGNKFLAMTGCYNLVSDKNKLNMKLRKNMSKAKWLRITLNSLDLYDMLFYTVDKDFNIKSIAEYNNVYNDQLQGLFTKTTGMYTSL